MNQLASELEQTYRCDGRNAFEADLATVQWILKNTSFLWNQDVSSEVAARIADCESRMTEDIAALQQIIFDAASDAGILYLNEESERKI